MSDTFSPQSLRIMQCMFLLEPDGRGVDLRELDELLRAKYGLTTDEADEWFGTAAAEGVVEMGPDRTVQ